MKVTFIFPSVGRKKNSDYVRTWQMEPLAIAVLSSLTPDGIEQTFFDDRMEQIDYSEKTDLVAISVETFTAKRAYQISSKYREQGVPVIMGGVHPTLNPDDALVYADTVVIGQAEGIWQKLLSNFQNGKLKRRYIADENTGFSGYLPNRQIYAGKKYLQLSLVETSRGCKYNCDFCSVAVFFRNTHTQRPVSDVIDEIKSLKSKYYFFTDDNLSVNRERFCELLKRLIPLKIYWSGQLSIDVAKDEELLKLMKKSGCVCVLIGFETLNQYLLKKMNKPVNRNIDTYSNVIYLLRKHGIAVYGTFLFGYGNFCINDFEQTLDFAKRNGFFFAAFNHLVPFPGTPLYKRMEKEGCLKYDKWWLSDEYKFGDIAFEMKNVNDGILAETCLKYRQKFYSILSIIRRLKNWKANAGSLRGLFLFLSLNLMSKNDVENRQNLPLGITEE